MSVSGGFAQERGDDAFHAHESGTLDEDRSRLGGIAERLEHRLDVGERTRARERRRRALALRARGPERLDAALVRIGADLAVERRPLVADLAHVPEDEPA